MLNLEEAYLMSGKGKHQGVVAAEGSRLQDTITFNYSSSSNPMFERVRVAVMQSSIDMILQAALIQKLSWVPRVLVELHPATVFEETWLRRKLGVDGRKRVRIYYRIPISVVAQGVKYGCLAIKGDDDLQIVFHCRRQFPEVRTTKLFVEVADLLASSGGSAPHPRPVNAGGPSGSRHQAEIDAPQVASPSFDFNLQPKAATGGTEPGDDSRFGVPEPDGAILPSVSPPAFEGVPEPDPQVEEALRADGSDVEP
ncbi:hypothetical protein PIB30_060234, partial [Stylosanthes scabra]|nr:hypothetical protein [Stylosanthes scabra]